MQSAVFGGVFTGFSIAADFEFGFARRMLLATRNRSALIAGYALTALVRALLVWAVVTVVALATGAEIAGSVGDLLGILAIAVMLNFAATLFASGMAMRFRTLQAAPLIQLPAFLIIMTAPVYVPARPDRGLGRDGRRLQPDDGDARGGPQPDHRRPGRDAARARRRRRPDRGDGRLGADAACAGPRRRGRRARAPLAWLRWPTLDAIGSRRCPTRPSPRGRRGRRADHPQPARHAQRLERAARPRAAASARRGRRPTTRSARC